MRPVVTDLQHDAFGGLRAFLAAAAGRTRPGEVAVRRPGHARSGAGACRARQRVAFEVAVRAVRCRVRQLARPRRRGAARLPAGGVHRRADARRADGSRVPDRARHRGRPGVGGARRDRARSVVTGLHVCATADSPSLVAIGPDVLSVPVDLRLLESAGYLARFLSAAAPSPGVWSPPTARSPHRPNGRGASSVELWCELVERGADPAQLRQQSIITPECGLGTHTPPSPSESIARRRGRRAGQGPGDGDALLARRLAAYTRHA